MAAMRPQSRVVDPSRRDGRALILLAGLAATMAGPPATAQERSGLLGIASSIFEADRSNAAGGPDEAAGEDAFLDFIETDRNSLTPSTKVTGRGVGILETAYTYLNFPGSGVKHSFPETLLRYGVTERTEIRFGWNFESGNEEQVLEGLITDFFGSNAEQQLYYGFKTQILEQEGRIPDIAFLLQGHTPTGGLTTATHIRGGITSGWRLPNNWLLDWSALFGTDSETDDRFEVWFPTAVVKIPFARNRWFTHLEYFGVFTTNKDGNLARNFLDTGLHHLLTPDLEIGVIIGVELVENPGYFIESGLGIRF